MRETYNHMIELSWKMYGRDTSLIPTLEYVALIFRVCLIYPSIRSFNHISFPAQEVPNFFSCLALIYPCVTGMMAGMSKSLHLKNPSHSIPKGTFWAIITCTIVYLTVCWLFGMTISNRTLKVDKFVTASVSFPHELIVRVGVVVSCFGLIL